MMMSTTTTQQHVKRVQVAAYSLENPEKTPQQLARKFSLDTTEVQKCIDAQRAGTLLKKRKNAWNPLWSHEDSIFHADDNYIQRDLELGCNLKSTTSHGLMDMDYDPVNGGVHLHWGEKEVETLLCSLPYRALEILRDTTPGSEDYEEALLFMDSDLMKAICKSKELDHEELLHQVLLITKAHI